MPHPLIIASNMFEENSCVAVVVRQLANSWTKNDCGFSIVSMEDQPEDIETSLKWDFYACKRNELMRGISFAQKDTKLIKDLAPNISSVSVHGFWLWPLVKACKTAQKLGLPVIISPHGMFSTYSMDARGQRKKIALKLGFLKILKNATAFHATSEEEAKNIRALGLEQPIFLIPNGVDIPDYSKEKSKKRTILFLSRVHPKKGLPLLVRAWAKLTKDRPDWEIVIAGPDEMGHRAEVQAIIDKHNIPRISFIGPKSGTEKASLYNNADIFILPTHNENFGLVVAEALAAGTPVITTTGTPWNGLEEHECGWYLDPTEEEIFKALKTATSMSSKEHIEMGLRGRQWMSDEFSWDVVSRKFSKALELTSKSFHGDSLDAISSENIYKL